MKKPKAAAEQEGSRVPTMRKNQLVNKRLQSGAQWYSLAVQDRRQVRHIGPTR
jgi:hypothetical protein